MIVARTTVSLTATSSASLELCQTEKQVESRQSAENWAELASVENCFGCGRGNAISRKCTQLLSSPIEDPIARNFLLIRWKIGLWKKRRNWISSLTRKGINKGMWERKRSLRRSYNSKIPKYWQWNTEQKMFLQILVHTYEVVIQPNLSKI